VSFNCSYLFSIYANILLRFSQIVNIIQPSNQQRGVTMAAKKKRPANRSIKAAATILENIGVVLTSAQQTQIRKAIK